MRVLVTGANGFIGSAVVAAVEAQGHVVLRVVRRARTESERAGDYTDLRNAAAWRPLLQGVDAVINCAGILRPKAAGDFERIHVTALAALVEAATDAGVKRLIQVSALGDPNATEFIASKHRGDALIMASPLAWTVLRPSLVYSPFAGGLARPPEHSGSHATAHAKAQSPLDERLGEYFDQLETPPLKQGKRRSTWREWYWSDCFETWFRKLPGAKSDPPVAAFKPYRARATDLNYHYSGLYRGTFLSNYGLAVVAVLFAALSLALLATFGYSSLSATAESALIHAGLVKEAHHLVSPKPATWLLLLLVALALMKLAMVYWISHSTHQVNHGHWNDRAIDFRYLAERLRGMYYLPEIGSHQPPAADPPQFATRVLRQSAVDWLFEALVRAISPASLEHARPVTLTRPDGSTLTVAHCLRLDPLAHLQKVEQSWLDQQAVYHRRNADTMSRMHRFIDNSVQRLSIAVMVLVAVDVLLIVCKVMHWLPKAWEPWAQIATVALILLTAVFPAVIAALNGLRSRSECQRLAERSAVMRGLLVGHDDHHAGGRKLAVQQLRARIQQAQSDPATDLGAWSLDALRLTEHIATDFVQEAAEWSVLYAKQLNDAG